MRSKPDFSKFQILQTFLKKIQKGKYLQKNSMSKALQDQKL